MRDYNSGMRYAKEQGWNEGVESGIKRGEQIGLKKGIQKSKIEIAKKMIEKEIQRLQHTTIGGKKEVQKLLEQYGSTLLQSGSTLADLLKRPELSYDILAPIDEDRQNLPEDVCEQVNISLKYEGYITRQQKQVAQYQKLENRKIPEDIDCLLYTSPSPRDCS